MIVGYSVVRRHFCRVGFAGGRCELRQQGGCPGPVGVETVRGFLQYPDKIAVRVKPVLLCRLDQAEQDRTALCTGRRVRKQEVLPRDHKRFNTPFGPVIAQLDSSVQQVGCQRVPLVQKIGQGNAKL